jgi:hypothetical protein
MKVEECVSRDFLQRMQDGSVFTAEEYMLDTESSVGFLGDVHATSAEPLQPRHIFRKHPCYGVLYQNWDPAHLKDGDVLVVRNNQSFFDAMNAGTTLAASQAQDNAEPSQSCQWVDQHIADEQLSFRSKLLRFFRDPNSSQCDAKPPCTVTSCVRTVQPTAQAHTTLCDTVLQQLVPWNGVIHPS